MKSKSAKSMTPLQIKKVAVLRLARKRIKSRQSNYICHALFHVGRNYPHLSYAAVELRVYIQGSLSSYAALEFWQVPNGFGRGYRQSEHRSKTQLVEDRLAWIDWMIRCLEGTEP